MAASNRGKAPRTHAGRKAARAAREAKDAPRTLEDARASIRAGVMPDYRTRLLSLDDLDLRTLAAKKAVGIKSGIMSDLGGEDRCSTAERQLAQRAAMLGAMSEDFETRFIRGDKIDHATYHAACNTQRRVLASLGLARRLRNVREIDGIDDLQNYLREKEQNDDADDTEEAA